MRDAFAFLAVAWLSLSIVQAKPRAILDADTANEIDDLYAIARFLKQDQFEILALSSAQWFHRKSGPRTVHQSQKINEALLKILDREDLPAPLGADEDMGEPWGGSNPKDSPAAQFIIESARATPEGEKLHVISLGATTNLASAVKIAPDIIPKIEAYLLGFRYDLKRDVWDKNEFNIRRDLNAANYLLNLEGLSLHVMPVTVAIDLRFDRDTAFAEQEKMGALGDYLTARWNEHCPDHTSRIMWDLALVIAILKPELATKKLVQTPPENFGRQIHLYDSIDVAGMLADYRDTLVPE